MARPGGSLTTGLRVTRTLASHFCTCASLGGNLGQQVAAGDAAVGLQVPLGGFLDYVLGQSGCRRLAVPARFEQPVADILFVEADLALPEPVLLDLPEAGGVGGEHLVNHD